MDSKSVLEKIRKLQKQGIKLIMIMLNEENNRHFIINIEKELGNLNNTIPIVGSNSIKFEKGYILSPGSVSKIYGLIEA